MGIEVNKTMAGVAEALDSAKAGKLLIAVTDACRWGVR